MSLPAREVAEVMASALQGSKTTHPEQRSTNIKHRKTKSSTKTITFGQD
jgi:hypothetical protein